MIAIAAADPSPAAVITCARGLATLPAAHTPATLVSSAAIDADEAEVIHIAKPEVGLEPTAT